MLDSPCTANFPSQTNSSQHGPATGSFRELNSRSLHSNTAYYFEVNFKNLFWSLLKHPMAFRFPDTLPILGIEIRDIDDGSNLCNYQRRYNYCCNLNTLHLTNKVINIRWQYLYLDNVWQMSLFKADMSPYVGVLWDYNNIWAHMSVFYGTIITYEPICRCSMGL